METGTGIVTTPRPFGEIPGLWLKVFQMDEAFFAAEAPRASNGNTLVALLIYAVATTIFGVIQSQIGFNNQLLQRYFGNTPQPNLPTSPVCAGLAALVLAPISYYIFIGLLHLGALIFRGHGSYTTLAYLVSLFYVPLGIASGLLGLIPCLGALISLAILVYSIILTIRAMKVNYQLTTGQAAGGCFLPSVAILFILGICMIGVVALLAPTAGTIFSNVMRGLGTPVP